MARTGSGQGGKRVPAKPAAVSGPGALSQRTDTPASQAVREFTAQYHGQRQQLRDQQMAAPMQAGPQGAIGGTVAPPATPPVAPTALFAPSERPGQAVAPSQARPPLLAEDPDLLFRAMYSIYPHPDIAALLDRR